MLVLSPLPTDGWITVDTNLYWIENDQTDVTPTVCSQGLHETISLKNTPIYWNCQKTRQCIGKFISDCETPLAKHPAWGLVLMQEFPQEILQCGLRWGIIDQNGFSILPLPPAPLAVTKPHQRQIRYKDGRHTVGRLRDTGPACEQSCAFQALIFSNSSHFPNRC